MVLKFVGTNVAYLHQIKNELDIILERENEGIVDMTFLHKKVFLALVTISYLFPFFLISSTLEFSSILSLRFFSKMLISSCSPFLKVKERLLFSWILLSQLI